MEDKFEAQIRELKQMLPDVKKMEAELAQAVLDFATEYNDAKFTDPITTLYDELKPKPTEKTMPDRNRLARIAGICHALLSNIDSNTILNMEKKLDVQIFVIELEKIQANALRAATDLSKIAALKAAQAEAENPVKEMTPPPSPKPQRIVVDMPAELKEPPAKPLPKDVTVESTDDAAEKMRKQQAAEEWAKRKADERATAEAERKKRDAESDKRIEMFGKLHEDIDAISEKLKAFEHRSLSQESRERLAALEHALQVEVHGLDHQAGEELVDFKKRLNAFVAECEKKFEEFVEGVKDQAASAALKSDDEKLDKKMEALLTSIDDHVKSSAGISDAAAQSLQAASKSLATDMRQMKNDFVHALATSLDDKRLQLSANIKISPEVIEGFEKTRLAAKDAELDTAINMGVKKWWDFLPTTLADTISTRLAGIPPYQERVDLVKQQCVSAQCVADLSDPKKFHSEHLDVSVAQEALAKGKFGDAVEQSSIVRNFLNKLGWREKVEKAIAEMESRKAPMKVAEDEPQRKRKLSLPSLSSKRQRTDDSEERGESRVKRAFSDLKDRLPNPFNKPPK